MIIMPRTKNTEMSPQVKEAYDNYQEARRKEVLENKRADAEKILRELEADYEEAKSIFFKVNGARRTLKALNA